MSATKKTKHLYTFIPKTVFIYMLLAHICHHFFLTKIPKNFVYAVMASPLFYICVVIIWVITNGLTPIGSKYVSQHMDHLTTSFVSYISRAIPFIVTYFALSSTNLIKPVNLFSRDNLTISSMELFRSISSILAFIILPSAIAQAAYFTFPIIMLWFNHTILGVTIGISSIISAILGLVGVGLVSFVGHNKTNGFNVVYIVGIILALMAACFQAYEVVFLKKEDMESSGGVPNLIDIIPQMGGFFTFGTIVATVLYAGYVMSNPLHGRFKFKGEFGSLRSVLAVIGVLLLTSFIPTLTHFVSLQGISPNAAALIPFSIVAVTVVVEWLFEGVPLDWMKLAGIGMICAGGLVSLWGRGMPGSDAENTMN